MLAVSGDRAKVKVPTALKPGRSLGDGSVFSACAALMCFFLTIWVPELGGSQVGVSIFREPPKMVVFLSVALKTTKIQAPSQRHSQVVEETP